METYIKLKYLAKLSIWGSVVLNSEHMEKRKRNKGTTPFLLALELAPPHPPASKYQNGTKRNAKRRKKSCHYCLIAGGGGGRFTFIIVPLTYPIYALCSRTNTDDAQGWHLKATLTWLCHKLYYSSLQCESSHSRILHIFIFVLNKRMFFWHIMRLACMYDCFRHRQPK